MEVEFPDDFRCPISLQVMLDPVIVASGHTFDRSSIQKWIDSGNRTCPVTKLPLPPRSPLIPNFALRSLIDNYSPAAGIKTPKKPQISQSPEKTSLLSSLTIPTNASERTMLPLPPLSPLNPNFSLRSPIDNYSPDSGRKIPNKPQISPSPDKSSLLSGEVWVPGEESSLLSSLPNFALRPPIDNYSPAARIKLPNKPQISPSPEKSSLLSSLAYPANASALSSLLRVAKKEPSFRRTVVDSGAPRILLRHAALPHPPDLQHLALETLLYLSLDGDDARVGLVADGALDSLAAALAAGGPNAALAATTITSLAVVEVNKCTIGAHPAAIPALSDLLRNGDRRARRESVTALYELCKFPENRRRAVRAGAVSALVCFSGDGSERAVQVLSSIAKCREGREAMAYVNGFVRVLGRVLIEGTPRGIEHVLKVLNLVCYETEEIRREAKKEGILEICLMLVGKNDGRIDRNALDLARTLQKDEVVGFIM